MKILSHFDRFFFLILTGGLISGILTACSNQKALPGNSVREEEPQVIFQEGKMEGAVSARSLTESLCKSRARFLIRQKIEDKYSLFKENLVKELIQIGLPDSLKTHVYEHLFVAGEWAFSDFKYSDVSTKKEVWGIQCEVKGNLPANSLLTSIEREGKEYRSSLIWIVKSGIWRNLMKEVQELQLIQKESTENAKKIQVSPAPFPKKTSEDSLLLGE